MLAVAIPVESMADPVVAEGLFHDVDLAAVAGDRPRADPLLA